jgi:hypothetical protein
VASRVPCGAAPERPGLTGEYDLPGEYGLTGEYDLPGEYGLTGEYDLPGTPRPQYSRPNHAARRRGKDRKSMAIGLYFTPSGFTTDKYDEAISRLSAAGAGAPEGRSYHVALETDGNIAVFDVWDSQEAFDAFGGTLLPILSELGVDPGAPMVMPVHSVITG